MQNITFPRSILSSILCLGLMSVAGCGGGGSNNSGTVTPTAVPTPVATTAPVAFQDLTPNLKQLLISSASSPELASGFRKMKDDGRLNWYFANLGLLPFVNSANKDLIRNYLDLFMSKINKDTGVIDDYNELFPAKRVASDSDDAYVSTFLSLACLYRVKTGDNVWWNANKENLKKIANLALITQQKSNKLIKTKISGNSTGYLIDNCENYGGLYDFSVELGKDGDSNAKMFRDAANSVAQGIQSLFNGDHFKAADAGSDGKFYADRVAQVFPQLYNVPLGSQTQDKYNKGWNYLNALRTKGEDWTKGENKDGSLGGFPWMVLGTVAAKRGDKETAKSQLRYFLENLNSAPQPVFTAVQEIGFATQLQNNLK